jgi:preprotein translocase subunit Sec63
VGGVISILRKFKNKETKFSAKNLVIHAMILVFLVFWTSQVYTLVSEDAAATQSFDPHEVLGVPQGAGFNSPEIKKAYRRLAV